MAGRVEVDPDVVLRLVVGERRAGRDRVRVGHLQILDLNVQARHHLLIPRTSRPHRAHILALLPKGEPGRLAIFAEPAQRVGLLTLGRL